MLDMKVCRKCLIEQPLSEFHVNNRGYNTPCRTCESKRYYAKRESRLKARADYVKRNKEKISIQKNRAGASIEEFNALFVAQNGCCKICNVHQSKMTRRISVDHCHETGKIRGLLCDKCNVAIGMLKDNISLLESAILYLKKAKEV